MLAGDLLIADGPAETQKPAASGLLRSASSGARNDYLYGASGGIRTHDPSFGGQCGTEILVGDKRSKMPLSAVLQGFRILLCLAV